MKKNRRIKNKYFNSISVTIIVLFTLAGWFVFSSLVGTVNPAVGSEPNKELIETHINAYQRGVRNTLKHITYADYLDHFERKLVAKQGSDVSFPVKLADNTVVMVCMRQ